MNFASFICKSRFPRSWEWQRHKDDKRYQALTSAYEIAINLASMAISATTAICVRNYRQLRRYSRHRTSHRQTSPGLSLKDPSPIVFVAATITYGLATFVYFESRKTDRYREWFLGTGVLAVIGAGVVTGMDAEEILLSTMPLALITSLVLCTASNLLWYYCKCNLIRHSLRAGEERVDKRGTLDQTC